MAKRIVIHDDELAPLEPHILILRDHGYSVAGIEGPPESDQIRTGDRRDFDLLVLDMLMPMPSGDHAVQTESGNRTGRWFLAEYRLACDTGVPVLLFSRLSHGDLLVAAWQAYENWRHRSGKSAIDRPDSLVAMEDKLIGSFNVWVRAKSEVKPTQMPDLVREIIGLP